jgi:CheY-like chemotaxis protein
LTLALKQVAHHDYDYRREEMQEGMGTETGFGMVPNTGRLKTILLVEDEPTVRNLLREVLQRSGYMVLACAHPEEGIESALRHAGPIDLLLTDVVMPGMNGQVMAKRIVESRPEVCVVFMSGYTEHVLLQDGNLEPRVEYLQKPFSLRTLREKVALLLDERRAQAS